LNLFFLIFSLTMWYLVLSILSSTAILLIFKYTERIRVHTFNIIVVNYIIAAGLGFAFSKRDSIQQIYDSSFYILAILIGIMFIIMFFVIARSTQTAGIAITSVATRMSLIFPVLLSLLLDPEDGFSMLKAGGIAAALAGVYLTIRKDHLKVQKEIIYFPLILFIGMGIVDSSVKYAQFKYITETNLPWFTAILFSVAAIAGITVMLSKNSLSRTFLNRKTIIWGSLLGIVNFSSLIFFVSALNYRTHENSVIDSSVVFGINHIGIVLLSVFAGIIFFREQLSIFNYSGILVSILAIIILAYSIR